MGMVVRARPDGQTLLISSASNHVFHPLVSGDPETVMAVGVSVRGRTVPEQSVKPGEWEDHVADWPNWEPPEEI